MNSIRIPILILVSCFVIPVFAADAPVRQTPKLFVTLPDYCPTPDGMEIACGKGIILAEKISDENGKLIHIEKDFKTGDILQ